MLAAHQLEFDARVRCRRQQHRHENRNDISGTETSIAVNPNNRNQIVISAFSSNWGAGNAVVWQSTDGGQTWTEQSTIPAPPGVPAA